MISTATRARPKTIVWRPARRNGSAQRWACVSAEPRAPVAWSSSGGSTRRMWRAPGRRPVAIDQPRRPAGELRGELGRVPDRRRGAHDDRVGAVVAAQPEQPAQDVRDVAAEHAPVGVQLVDDDHPDLLEELEPLRVVGEDRRVEHVRVRDDDLARRPDRRPDRRRRVAVVGGRGDLERAGARQLRRTRRPGPGRAPSSGTGRAPAPTGPRRAPGARAARSTASCPRRWA